MGIIFEAVRQFFDEDNWRYCQINEEPVLMMDVSGKSGHFTCYARAREDAEQFIFYAVCPITAPENKRHAISEYLSRANYGLVIGNFELDFRDGEIRYKTSIDVEGAQLTPPLVKNMVYVTISMADKYLPGILSIIYGNMLPEDAITMVEG